MGAVVIVARIERPLFGDEATGSVGQSITFLNPSKVETVEGLEFRRWQTSRHKFHHTNPKTPPQTLHRLLYHQGAAAWNSLSRDLKYSWNVFAIPPQNGYNTFLHYFLTGEIPEEFIYMIQAGMLNPLMKKTLFNRLTPHLSIVIQFIPSEFLAALDNPELSHYFEPRWFTPTMLIYIPYIFAFLKTQIRYSRFPSFTPGLNITLLLRVQIIAAAPQAPASEVMVRTQIQISAPTIKTEVKQL